MKIRHTKFLSIIFFISILIFSNCSKNQTEELNTQDDYFGLTRYDDYKDLFKQADVLNQVDTAKHAYALIIETLKDSLCLNNSTNGILFMNLANVMGKDGRKVKFYWSYQNNDSVEYGTPLNSSNNFFATLEALKQLRNKIEGNPSENLEIVLNEENVAAYVVNYNKENKEWHPKIILNKNKYDSTKYIINLTVGQFDSIIKRMNRMRDYLLHE